MLPVFSLTFFPKCPLFLLDFLLDFYGFFSCLFSLVSLITNIQDYLEQKDESIPTPG